MVALLQRLLFQIPPARLYLSYRGVRVRPAFGGGVLAARVHVQPARPIVPLAQETRHRLDACPHAARTLPGRFCTASARACNPSRASADDSRAIASVSSASQ